MFLIYIYLYLLTLYIYNIIVFLLFLLYTNHTVALCSSNLFVNLLLFVTIALRFYVPWT